MKRFTTIICSIAFAVFGVCIATNKIEVATQEQNVAYAQPIPNFDLAKVQVPKDIQMSLYAKQLESEKATSQKAPEVTIVASKRVKERVRVVHKTSYVPVLYIATPKKEASKYQYDVQRADIQAPPVKGEPEWED